ncbi:inositol monophosphatase family protein [Trueperella bialowiezensis]|uniref:Inositol-1-monophosphatase n=1 Tax=Trueperella bialowiezensis TaxID=312285 RepID=A0A448PEY5_9ACTO|nr:inositol monophosphatase family protein [Trueperella bialowiezensis]VEI13502.1 Inositol-1-monophosphatase [Trueperella bialowiezensis]
MDLRTIAEQAATLCGDDLRAAFRSDMDVSAKHDRHDLVTEYDGACERRIVAYLEQADPEARILGEEAGFSGGNGERLWHIDPIDGTSNFVQGLAFFCTSVGVEENGQLVAGAVYDPMANNLFSADLTGAYLNGAELRTPPALPTDAATVITGYPTARDLEIDGPQAIDELHSWIKAFSSVRRTGSGALSLCHVAAGWTDSAFGSSIHSWDVAAAILILRQAGGTYTPLRYPIDGVEPEAGDHYAPGYVATGPGGHYPALNTSAEHLVAWRTRLS